MEKIILNDGSEILIKDNASLYELTVEVDTYSDLEELSKRLTRDNLKEVKFVSEDYSQEKPGSIEPYGVYTNMTLREPNFSITQLSNSLIVVFGLRELTSEEIKEPDVQMAISFLTDEQAAIVKDLFPEWNSNSEYAKGDRVQYIAKLYKCLAPHQAQPTWTPDAAPSLWAEILTRPGEILPWVQPGSTNGYRQGDRVTHNGQTWESLVDNNVWEPGTIGTESLWIVVAEN